MPSRSSSLPKTQRGSIVRNGESPPRRAAASVIVCTERDPKIAPAPTTPFSRIAMLIPESLRHDMIRDAAYLRAQARGFAPGREIEDWLAAEQEVDEVIVRRYGR